MKNRIGFVCAALLLLFNVGCGKTDNNVVPGKATLSFPAKNSLCTSGTVVSSTKSTITFTWNSSDKTDSYELGIINLITGEMVVQNTTNTQISVSLLRDTPYSWYVISKSTLTTTTTKSDTWKFYNSGLGTLLHPPFPADGLSPTMGQNVTATGGTVKLSWTGSDVDNDIAGYDIYWGTTATPIIFKGNVTDMFVNSPTVVPGTTYYWEIITKDAQGNTSDTGVLQFKVN